MNKDVIYSIKQNKEIDIILKDSTKITIKKQNFYINVIERDNKEKQNSINLNKENSNQINKLENDKKSSVLSIDPLPQKVPINQNDNSQINEPINITQSTVQSMDKISQMSKINQKRYLK